MIIRLPLPAPEQCCRTHSSTCAHVDNTLVRGGELILHCFRHSCTPAVREESSAMLCSEAFRSCSCFPAHQFFLEDDRVEADATLHHGLGLGWVWVGFWVGLQWRKPNPEKTQPINPNPENSGLTQYIQIVIVVFMVVSQSESEGHSHLLIWSLSRMLSHRLIWPFLTV